MKATSIGDKTCWTKEELLLIINLLVFDLKLLISFKFLSYSIIFLIFQQPDCKYPMI